MEWFESEAFWAEIYDYVFPAERLRAAAEQVEQILRLVPGNTQRVLDLCCGPGAHAGAFARLGRQVTGVDRTGFLIERARASWPEVEFVRADARCFVRPGAFDLCTILYNSFGYFEDPGDDLLVLQNVCESLGPGGSCVLDLTAKEVLAGSSLLRRRTFEDGTLLIEHHTIEDAWSRARVEWLLVRGGEARRFEFTHRLYSASELRSLLLHAGFARADCYDGMTGAPYGPGAQQLLAIARR